MGIADACAVLSRPFPSSEMRLAADRLLSLDSESMIGDVYHFLVWQRTLRMALSHIAESGADLNQFRIAPQTFHRTFPAGYKPIWDVAVSEPVTARRMLDTYAVHKRLLAEPVLALLDQGCDEFTLLSGRAYQVRYPTYEGRVEFDTDLLAPDIATALRAASLLEKHGFELDTVRVRRLGSAPDATVEICRQVDGHRVSVGILVGGYHAYRAPIHGRAEARDFAGRTVRVPQPEDLLVMLAARAERKRSFALVNVNDAAVILAEDGGSLDWDAVVDGACGAKLQASLLAILLSAAELLDADVVPRSVLMGLRRASAISGRIADAALRSDVRFGEDTQAQRAARQAWLVDSARRDVLRAGTPGLWSRTARRAQRRVLRKQIRTGSVGMMGRLLGKAMTGMRTRSGAFCEVAPHLAAGATCVSRFGPWRGNVGAHALLRVSAHDIEPSAGPHRCNRATFDLSERLAT